MNDIKSTLNTPPEEDTSSGEQALEVDGEPPEPRLRILIANQQETLAVKESLLHQAVHASFRDSPYDSGCVSIAIVDDPTIHDINRRYLKHDYPTDVLSFVLEDSESHLEGELVVSADTAANNAIEYGWPALDELLLYVVHGALHLVGYLDKRPKDIAAMREAEARVLREIGVELPSQSQRWSREVPRS